MRTTALRILLALMLVRGSDSNNIHCSESRSTFLSNLLSNETYDRRISPTFDTGNYTLVTVDIFINSFDSLSDATMDYALTIYLRQRWEDPRLAFASMCNDTMFSLDSDMSSMLWTPDLFFPNEKSGYAHEITKPNKLLYLYSNGTIYYSMRLTIRLSCPEKFHSFPMDTQTCALAMESFAYPTDKLRFAWMEGQSVQQALDLELPNFSVRWSEQGDCTKQYVTGEFTCIHVVFTFTRNIGFYLMQLYIPSGLTVILSWVSFWVDAHSVPARISLGVLTILTLITQSSGFSQSLPKVSYVKAVDIWTTMCLLFVVLALVEFACIHVQLRNTASSRRCHRPQAGNSYVPKDSTETLDTPLASMTSVLSRTFPDRCRSRDMSRSSPARDPSLNPPYNTPPRCATGTVKYLDQISRLLFPIAFAIFNVMYWSIYTRTSSD